MSESTAAPGDAGPRAPRSSRRLHALLLLAAAVVLVVAAVWAAAQAPPVRRIAHRHAEGLLRASLGREVQIQAVRLHPWTATLELQELRLGGPSLRETRLAAAAVRVRWSWLPLLRRQLLLREVVLIRPRAVLPPAAARRAPPWLPPGRPILHTESGWTVSVEAVSVTEGSLRWSGRDGAAGLVEGLGGRVRWAGPAPRAVVWLEARRLVLPFGAEGRQLDAVRIDGDWDASRLGLREARFTLAGAQVRVTGEVQGPMTAPVLDLRLEADLAGVAVPIAASGVPAVVGVQAAGRVEGPLAGARFTGEGGIRSGAGAAPLPLRLQAWWEGTRVRVQGTALPAGGEPVAAELAFTPGTGDFLVAVRASQADLAAFGAWPAALAARAGLALPERLRGRLTAALEVSGRGADLGALRGEGTLRVDDLGVPGALAGGGLEARARATATRLTLDGFRLGLPAGELSGRGTLELRGSRFQVPLHAEIRDVAAFGRTLGLPLLAGRGTFVGELAGTPDDPRLRGRLAWHEARLGRHALDLIEGDVEVGARRIRSPGLRLRSGRTAAVLRGSAVALGKKPLRTLDLSRELHLEVTGEVPSGRTIDLADYLPPDLEIQGTLRARGRLAGTLRALEGQVELQMEELRTWRERWDRAEALLVVDGGGLAVRRIVARRTADQVTGEVRVQGGNLRGRLASEGLELRHVGWLARAALAGRASVQVDLSGTTGEPQVHGRAESASLVFRGVPLGGAQAAFTVVGRRSVQVDLTSEGRRLQLALDLPRDSLRADLAVTDGDLVPLLRAAGGAVEGLRLRGSGRARLQGAPDDLMGSQGELDFDGVRLTATGGVWESRGPVRAAWRAGLLTLQPLRLRSGEREFLVQGTLGAGQQADLAVRGELPLAALGAAVPRLQASGGLARADLRVRGPIGAPDLRGRVTVLHGTVGLPGLPVPVQEVDAEVLLEGERIRIPTWQGRLGGGQIRGTADLVRGTADLVRGTEGSRVGATFALEGARVEQLLRYLRGRGELTGSVSLTGTLRSHTGDPATFWRNLNGNVKVLLRDGQIGRHTVLARLLSVLNVAELLNLRIPELAATGMPYRQLTADVTVSDGVARTENLLLDAPAMKVNAVGEVSLVAETVDLSVAVKPFQTVDTILTKIPLAGWLLGGREKSLIVASFHVTGPLQEPDVTPLPLRDVQRNVFGIFQRILDLPEFLTSPFEHLPPQPARPAEGPDR